MDKPPEQWRDGWSELVTVTEAMLRSAQEQDWEQLVILEQERCLLLKERTIPDGAVDPLTTEEREALSALIRAVLDLDEQIVALAGEARQALLGKIQGLRVGARARAAYGQLG